MDQNKPPKLTNKQRAFCDEYLIDLNGTQAAIRAGYSIKTACAIGWENLRKPDIRNFINAKLTERSLSADETTKLITDIARGNLGDYFVTRVVEHTPKLTRPLKDVIEDFKKEISFEEEFLSIANYSKVEEVSKERMIGEMKRGLLRMQLELKHNPSATKIVNGETVLAEVVELDMKKLVADKERGRIKSITPGEFGVKVEIHDAHTALTNIARMHGLFEKDNKQLNQTVKIVIKKNK